MGPRSELVVMGQISDWGHYWAWRQDTSQAGGNLSLTKSQSHTSNLYSNVLESSSYIHLPIVILEICKDCAPCLSTNHDEFVCDIPTPSDICPLGIFLTFFASPPKHWWHNFWCLTHVNFWLHVQHLNYEHHLCPSFPWRSPLGTPIPDWKPLSQSPSITRGLWPWSPLIHLLICHALNC